MYAVIATAEFQGPETRTKLMAITRTRATADQLAQQYGAADIAAYGCSVLEHGQASGWSYRVRRISPRERLCPITGHYYRTYMGCSIEQYLQ